MDIIIKKRKITLFIIGITVLLIISCVIMVNNNEVYADKVVQANLKMIDKSIKKAIEERSEVAFSSSPFAYVESNKYYDEIIQLGVEAIPELEKELSASDINGLNEYIMAMAIQEISRTDVSLIIDNDSYAWFNAKQFLSNWEKSKEVAKTDIIKIYRASDLTEKEKCKKISAFGILAVPILNDILPNRSTELTSDQKELYKYIDMFNLSNDETKLLEDILQS